MSRKPPQITAATTNGRRIHKPTFLGRAPRLSAANTRLGGTVRPLALQAKLLVGHSDDPLEREADRVADEVMRMPDTALPPPGTRNPLSNQGASLVQRQEAEEEDEEKKEDEGENGLIQTKPLIQGRSSGATNRLRVAPPIVHEALRSPGRPLDSATRAFFEPRFGMDFSWVRIHTDEKAVAATRMVRARAFTLGRDIVFASGEFKPDSWVGRQLLAHELTHVVQRGSTSNYTLARRVTPRSRRKNTCPIINSKLSNPLIKDLIDDIAKHWAVKTGPKEPAYELIYKWVHGNSRFKSGAIINWGKIPKLITRIYIISYLTEKHNLNLLAAAAFVGNFDVESDLVPFKIEGRNPKTGRLKEYVTGSKKKICSKGRCWPRGLGLAQWTTMSRRRPFMAKPEMLYDINVQLDYVISELQGRFKGKLVFDKSALSPRLLEYFVDQIARIYENPHSISGRRFKTATRKGKRSYRRRRRRAYIALTEYNMFIKNVVLCTVIKLKRIQQHLLNRNP